MIQLFQEVSGACFIFNESEKLLEEVVHWGRFAPQEKIFAPNDCWALRRGHIHVIDADEAMAPRCRHLRHESTAYVCVPLLAQGKALGVLYLSSDADPESKARNQRGLQLVETASNSISLALANLQLRESLALLSLSDPLTGLYNRRFMEETLARELSRVSRNEGTLVIAMLDIDRFKDFNDAYGHDAGDFVLKEFAAQMKRFRHGTDVSCRYGGEEFVLILPEIAPETAVERLDQLRRSIGELSLDYHGRVLPPITVSIGVASFPGNGTNAAVLIRTADEAMYRAKREGRNRLVAADTPG
jgi:diguanylate cyclase (GGDEF)-like protein